MFLISLFLSDVEKREKMEAKNFLTARERKEKNLFRESDKKFRCEFCEIFFSRNRDCIRHEKNFHKIRRVYSCSECEELFYSYEDILQHGQKHIETSLSFRLHKRVFNGASEIFRKRFDAAEGDPINILFDSSLQKEICNIMKHQVLKRKRMTCCLTAHAIFLKFNEHGDIAEKITFVANSGGTKFSFTDTKDHFLKVLKEKMGEIEHRLLDFSENGSGWTISELTFFDLTFATLGGLRGGCHMQVKSVNGLLNIISEDNKCLVYAILAHFFKKTLSFKDRKNSQAYLPYFSHLNLEGINFPIEPFRLDEIENRKHDVKPFKINVFIQEGNEVYPYRLADTVSDDEKIDNVIRINLLLVEGKDVTTGAKIYHYIYIENIDRFLRKKYQNSSFSKTINCHSCFASFRSENRRDQHEKWCASGRKTLVYFETDVEKKIKYLKQANDSPHILCGFVDFESVLKKEQGFGKTVCEDCEKIKNSDCKHSFTREIHEHKAVNYTFLVVDRDYKVVYQKIYTGEDSAENFIQTLINKEDFFREILTSFQEMDFTDEDRLSFENCDFCYLCSSDFSAESIREKGQKVRDHCHITGRYISAAHNLCNLSRREKVCVKIFAHNFSGYDSHLIISHLDHIDIENIHVIPKSGEKFMAIFLNNFYGLLDSKSFLSGSLDSLIKTLPKDHDYSILRQSKFVKKRIKTEKEFSLLFEKWKFRKFLKFLKFIFFFQ